MTSLLEAKVTEYLTEQLGRVPTSSEIADGLKAPLSLAFTHNTVNSGQSILSIDNTQDIQDAINTVSNTGGGTLYLKGGTYNLSSNISIPSNVIMQGVGSGGTILDFGGAAYQVRVVGSSGAHIQSPAIKGITVQNSSIEGIRIDYVDNFLGNDIECNDCSKGIYATNVSIFNINIYSSDSCGTGIEIDTCSVMTLNNQSVSVSTSAGGFIFTNVDNATFINSSTESGTGVGILLDTCSDFTLDSFSVTGMSGIGISLNGTSIMSASSGTITNNGSDGIKLVNTLNCQFVTSNINTNGGYGVNITSAGSQKNLFAINDFSSNSSGAMNNSGTSTLIRSNIGLADN